ncbi:MAG: peptide chain release factor N(5)-glutamine methyltransferase [Trueperaceae bacterium]
MDNGTNNGESERPHDVAAARRLLVRRLTAAGVPSPQADAMLLLEGALGVDRQTLLLQPDRPVSPEAGARLADMLRRRVAREPLQLILGQTNFYGLDLAVTPGVLVPRPETERLVELVLQELRTGAALLADGAPTVLDVGTGTGAVALAIKAELPSARVWGSDVTPEAVSLAKRNAATLGLEVSFRLSDLLADPDVAYMAAHCSALVSNPPYLPDSDRKQLPPEVNMDPGTALFAGADGLEVARRLAWQTYKVLPSGALLALELDPRNVHKFASLLVGWKDVRVESDLGGRARFVLARR